MLMADGMFKTDPKETETEGMNGGNIFRCNVRFLIPNSAHNSSIMQLQLVVLSIVQSGRDIGGTTWVNTGVNQEDNGDTKST